MSFYHFLFFLIYFFLSYLHRMGFFDFYNLLSVIYFPSGTDTPSSLSLSSSPRQPRTHLLPYLPPSSLASSPSAPGVVAVVAAVRLTVAAMPAFPSPSPPDAINTEGHFGTSPTRTKAGAGEASFLGSIFSEWLQSARFAGIQA